MQIKKLPFAIILLCVLAFANTSAQNYEIGQMSMDFVDSSRNRTIPVDIYYPAEVPGTAVPFPAANSNQFPLVVFGHGFVMSVDAYDYLWQNLVPAGFILVFPKTEGGIFPSHSEFAKDLAYAVQQMANLNADTTSLFYGRVSAFNAVMGHSMGGGASFLAAELNPSITSLVSLAAAETNPSAIAAAANLNIPSLIFAGSNDCVTPPSTNQLPMYTALQSGCKTYINISGGSHCQMADTNFLCQLGEATCSPSAAISRDLQHQILLEYTLPWLRAQLNADCESGAAFNDMIALDERITFEKNCDQCEVLAVDETFRKPFEMFPNPFEDILTVRTANSIAMVLTLFDTSARIVVQKQINDGEQIAVGHLESGLYLYTLAQSNQTVRTGKLVKQ